MPLQSFNIKKTKIFKHLKKIPIWDWVMILEVKNLESRHQTFVIKTISLMKKAHDHKQGILIHRSCAYNSVFKNRTRQIWTECNIVKRSGGGRRSGKRKGLSICIRTVSA